MSFYRSLLAAVAAMGLVGAVFADDSANTANAPAVDTAKMVQTADASSTNQAAPATANADQPKVDINKASAKDLAKVKGMNANKAKAIISYRKKHGDFKSVDDLKLVKGFKRMKSDRFKQIEDQLTAG